ncbi:MAG: hypothetical protein PVTTEEND_001081 [Candidatus Fervidibacter sp.]
MAEVGEWRGGEWSVLTQASLFHHADTIAIKIADDLKGEVVWVR